MADDVDFDPTQVYHYRGGGIPGNVRAGVVRVAIAPSVEEIPDETFLHCVQMEEVLFSDGEGLRRIGAWAFAFCRSLRSFRCLSTVTEIGEGAFDGCLDLRVVVLPHGLASIEESTFAHCTSLEAIRIPPSVTLIGPLAFAFCTNLASIETSEGLLRIDDYAFKGCRGLRNFPVPSSVIEIGGKAFGGCRNLEHVHLHEDLPRLGWFTFRGCRAARFRFARLTQRTEAIALDARSASELEGVLNEIASILVVEWPKARECQEILRRAHGVLTDSLRADTTTLELALWKKKIDEEAERDPRPSRQECRTNSGGDMDVMIRRVLEFIPSPWS